jgi:hypothetical protein
MQMIGTVSLHLKMNWFNCTALGVIGVTMTHTTHHLIYVDVQHDSFCKMGSEAQEFAHFPSSFIYL